MGRWFTVALVLTGLLAGCSDDSRVPVLTSASVMRCVLDGGGEKWPLTPQMPKGAPTRFETVYTIGPDRGHIGILISRPHTFTERLAKEFDEIGEYRATPTREGRVLVLLDGEISKADRTVAFECVEG
jgi:hypothetical protein